MCVMFVSNGRAHVVHVCREVRLNDVYWGAGQGEIMGLRLLCGHVRIGHGEGNKRAPDERRRPGIGAEKSVPTWTRRTWLLHRALKGMGGT